MSFQWLQMRITEEKERRQRESSTMERMPRALSELRDTLSQCVADFNQAFGADSAHIQMEEDAITVNFGAAQVRVVIDLTLPGFIVDRGSNPLPILVGMLPGDKLFYRDGDKYLTADDLTRRILDRTLFPKLTE
jgi:hypothetical protein